MNNLGFHRCTICGAPRPGNQRWFLVHEDCWQDKLRILHWDEYMAAQENTHSTCGAAHLQQLVVHWMTTGSLDHPFAQPHSGPQVVPSPRRMGWAARNESSHPGPRPIGELTVHRESMQRVLRENPQSLRTVLDALLSALQREAPRPEPKVDWDREATRLAAKEV